MRKSLKEFANSKFFKDTTMGKKFKKPFKVYPINQMTKENR